MNTINRKDLPTEYQDMMQTEQHHTHEIVKVRGSIRWKKMML